jgi:hypothetical protein
VESVRLGHSGNAKGVESGGRLEKREKFESLDFVEKGLYDVFWALVVTLRERLGDEVLVDRWDVRHVVAGCDDLCLVRRVLDVVLDVFEFCFQITHELTATVRSIRTFGETLLPNSPGLLMRIMR